MVRLFASRLSRIWLLSFSYFLKSCRVDHIFQKYPKILSFIKSSYSFSSAYYILHLVTVIVWNRIKLSTYQTQHFCFRNETIGFLKRFMIKPHTSHIRMTREYIRVTYGWHTSTYEWHTDDIQVHKSDIRMTCKYIRGTHEYMRVTYEWHTSAYEWHTDDIQYIRVTYQWHTSTHRWFTNTQE